MGKTAFVSMTYSRKHHLKDFVDRIKVVLRDYAITPKVFVEDYNFALHEEDEMMRVACDEIASCDFLIAELSYKAIGVGVEVGFAAGLGKPIIYMRHVDTEHSTTVSGISTHTIIYSTLDDMETKLRLFIAEIGSI